ncbi:MAG: hypothetical protein ACLSH8_10745 [Zhenhengia sp.]|uniref:hypothetical protein n=1 Tax=Zhenhengia sp. TaxID=2944208 RepID=UPI0039926807
MAAIINLDKFAGGALAERVNQAITQVLENIKDPNTDHKVKRKVTLELTFVTDEAREMTQVSVIAKTKTAPQSSVSSVILIDTDNDGEVLDTEFRKQIPGQQAIVVNPETGEVTELKVEKLEAGLQLVR